MASNADGHIIIDLQLQQDEFDKRLKEVEGKTSNFGSKVKTAMKAAVVAGVAAFATLVKKAVDTFAEYEQLVGGVETLFKKSKDVVLEYADNAYKTAGMSANEYMSTVTSFSASLLQSLNNDTAKAAKVADRAITDMSDNANKMGTDISMIQNAYQGFAKQNYTMLDNLKLGYGGTKTEMQRLIKDASQMNDVQKKLGITVDGTSMSFGNIVNAISVMQESMGIAGTTAKEASTTIEGSANSMKAAWTNFLTGMADGTQDVDKLTANLVDSIVTYVKNIGPRIVKTIPALSAGLTRLLSTFAIMILQKMPEFIDSGMDMILSISEGFEKGFPGFISALLKLIQQFANNIAKSAPTIISKGYQMLSNLVSGIIKALPILISQVPNIITTFANIINDNFPAILAKGAELLWEFILGILSAIPVLIANIPQIIQAIVSVIQAFNWLNLGRSIIDFFGKGIKSMVGFVKANGGEVATSIWNALTHLPQTLLNLGKNIISKLGNGITNSSGTVKGAIKGICNAVVNGIKGLPSKMITIGSQLIQGLWSGISNKVGWLGTKIKSFGNSVISQLKDFFGIHSPSKLMADKIGQYLPKGLVVGVENEMPETNRKMAQNARQIVDDFENEVNNSATRNQNNGQYDPYPYGNPGNGGDIDYTKLGNEVANAIANTNLKIKVNGKDFGRVVKEVQ